jgi:RimJ/RimL family protein N-acetyltransferase
MIKHGKNRKRIMTKILVNLPEIIEAPKLTLQMPKAGFGENLYHAICEDYEDYVRWLNWPEIMPTLQELEIECRRHHAEFILRDFVRYLIIDKETKDIIGRCAFPPFQANWEIPRFGISYFIRKNARSKGYATTASHIMAILAFRVLQAKKVEIYCDAENVASIKVALKLGFKLEYTQKGGWPRQDGKLMELQTYSIFSEKELPDIHITW